jgi:hypothetical protein
MKWAFTFGGGKRTGGTIYLETRRWHWLPCTDDMQVRMEKRKMKTSKFLLKIYLIVVFIVPVFLFSVPAGYAQTDLGWSEPVNISLSGSSTNPSIVVDAKGTIHVIWFDKLDRYKYAESVDGISWSSPQIVNFPFSREGNTSPTFLVDDNEIHILWLDRQSQTLYYSRSLPANLDVPSTWTNFTELADWVVNYDAKIGVRGNLYVSYINTRGTTTIAPGVYVRRLDGAGWSQPKSIYASQYFRSLSPEDSNIRLGVSDGNDTDIVFLVWDDRANKNIFLAESQNNGNDWGTPVQISGPDDYMGLTFPFNINIGFRENNPLLIWWAGIPGEYCSLYSQLYDMDGNQLDGSSKQRKELSPCPQSNDFIVQGGDLPVLSLNSQDELSFVAWDGNNWSAIQAQRDLSVFENPVTLDGVLFGCRKITFYLEKIYVVGCDTGIGGDIWFRSRELGSRDAWFPPPSAWKPPVQITNVDEKITRLTSVDDEKNNVHTFWIQSSLSDGGGNEKLYYSRWGDDGWSKPMAILAELEGRPIQFSTSADIPNRLLLAWVDGQTGGIQFSWSNSDRAASSSEWDAPVFVPTVSPVTSAPKILADMSGRVIIVYAVPVNEQRGIYFISSDDAGRTWSGPFMIFDAIAAGWDVVDKPEISLSGDGRLHILFERFSLQGDQRRSMGVYYSQSTNGGGAWIGPELVSDQPISWSRVIGHDETVVHRLWQERNGTELVDYHQISWDGGMSWDNPISIGAGTGEVSSPSVEIDRIGSLHLLQLVQNEGVEIVHQSWTDSQWIKQESFNIDKIENFNASHWLTSSLSLEGNLIAIDLMSYQDPAGKEIHELISTSRSLGAPSAALAQPILIPTSDTSVSAIEVQEVLPTPTQISSLENISEPSTSIFQNKNVVGLFFVVGALILTIAILRPRFIGGR